MLRLFVGIKIPKNIVSHINLLRGGLKNARWTRDEDLHITMRFIGDVPENMGEYVHEAMSRIDTPVFEIGLKEIGFFTRNKKQPKTIWTGVNDSELLTRLHDKLDNSFIRAGFEPYKHKYHPHCTIAKLKEGAYPEDVYEYVAQNNLFKSEMFKVEELTLYSSHRYDDGATYEVLGEYPLRLK